MLKLECHSGGRVKSYLIFFIGFLGTAVLFQNCSELSSNTGSLQSVNNTPFFECEETQDCSEAIEEQNVVCFFNGLPIPHGSTVEAWSSAQSTNCESQTRVCNNGNLSGDFQYRRCIDPTNTTTRSCLFNGEELAHGESVTGFLNGTPDSEGNCQSEQRTCDNGILSGSFVYNQCSSQTNACLFNGRALQNGEYVQAFRKALDGQCESEFRVCQSGVLSGSFNQSNCLANKRPCLFNGLSLIDGESVTAFSSFNTLTMSCTSETRTCSNGILSGGLDAVRCVTPADPKNCRFVDREIIHGQSFTAFRQITTATGKQCENIQRTCDDGEIIGDDSYNLGSCNTEPEASCAVQDKLILHGDSIQTFQYERFISSTDNCEALSKISTCVDGSFDTPPQRSLSCDSNPVIPSQQTGTDCEFRSLTIDHGRGRWFFISNSVDYGATGYNCHNSENAVYLRCENGVMRPTDYELRSQGNFDATPYSFDSCTTTANDCDVNGNTISHNGQITRYSQETGVFGSNTCSGNNRLIGRCLNGQMIDEDTGNVLDFSGHPFTSCSLTGSQCNFNGTVFDHQETIGNVFENSNVPFSEASPSGFERSCFSNDNRIYGVCIDGVPSISSPLSPTGYHPFDTNRFNTQTCSVTATGCNYQGQALAHLDRITLYRQAQVTAPATCDDNNNSVQVVCVDGEFKEWRDENFTTIFNGNGLTFVTPDPAPLIDSNQFPSNTCSVN